MDAIKPSASILVACLVCLTLLLIPGIYRNEVSINERLPARQELTRIEQQQTSFRFEREQPAPQTFDDVQPIVQDEPVSRTTSPPTTQSVDWLKIMYPELTRIQMLEHQPADTALTELLPMLDNDDPVIRLAAIEALGDMAIPATLPALSASLNDPNPQLRIAALEALASQEDESSAFSIEPYLYDQNREVRLTAMEALEDLESLTAVHAVAGLLSDQDTLVRQHAVDALGEIGGKNAVIYLLQARYDPDATIRANVEAILAELEISALD